MAPFPPSGQYLDAVRDSSKKLREAAGIKITEEGITRLLLSPTFTGTFQRVSQDHGLALPLNFSSPLDELNFISILSLLNFGSAYRVPLHEQTKRGAWDSMRALMFSLYISSGDGDLLSARGMTTLSVAKIAELMGISLHVERPHEKLPGITVGELGGPLYELVGMISLVLKETGEILRKSGYQNLGAFVAEALKSTENLPADQRADVIVERLVKAFPGFRDMSDVLDTPIYCFKKALFLVESIVIRFGSKKPPPFPIPTTDKLPVFSDNVLPSILIHLGVLDVKSSPIVGQVFSGAGTEESLTTLLAQSPDPGANTELKSPPKSGPFLDEKQAYALRAAAIDACQRIVEVAKTLPLPAGEEEKLGWIHDLTLPTVDMWLWAVPKSRKDYRALERIVARGTVFF